MKSEKLKVRVTVEIANICGMDAIPDFKIQAVGNISRACIDRGLMTFRAACDYVMHLDYGRNPDKEDPISVFRDNCGTCSTKHALLMGLAMENDFPHIRLILGIIKMTKSNTPEISETLAKNKLDYIPEAHNYLKYEGRILDLTKPGFTITYNTNDLLLETELLPGQITHYKVNFHKAFLAGWLERNPDIPYSVNELWEIREQCIRDLSVNGN